MEYVKFNNDDKIRMFDEIAECFYKSNFGQMSKSEIELMMFRFYIERMIIDNRAEDGTIDYKNCSDYKISKDLGITQQRVRNLKVKNQLVNPIQYDWKVALAKLTDNARYEKSSHKIRLNIPDPNLYLEIQNFIEDQGAYVEKQLNSKILQLRAEYFIDLVIALESEETRKTIIKTLKTHFRDEGKDDTIFDERNIGKFLIDITANITSVAITLSNLISPDNIVGASLLRLITKNN